MGRKKQEIDPICGKRLQSLLDEYGMTQVQFAKKTIYTKEYINRMVRGSVAITPDKAKEFTSKLFPGVRWEWLMGWDDFETEADKKLAETYEVSDKIFEDVNRTDDHARKVTAILSAMDYHLYPTGYTDVQRENDKEIQDACTFFNILETDNKYINNRIPMALLQELREKINTNSTTTCDDNPSLGDMILSGFSDIEEKTKQEIIDDPTKYLISAKHYATQIEQHQQTMEYDLCDGNGNKLLHLGKYEKYDFINQIYDVVTALIQYHISKKKGQP